MFCVFFSPKKLSTVTLRYSNLCKNECTHSFSSPIFKPLSFLLLPFVLALLKMSRQTPSVCKVRPIIPCLFISLRDPANYHKQTLALARRTDPQNHRLVRPETSTFLVHYKSRGVGLIPSTTLRWAGRVR